MARSLRSSGALRTLLFCVAAVWAAVPTLAQTPEPIEAQAPAHVAFVDGVVVLERDGQIDDAPGSMPLLAGDRLRTRGGRVEVLYADGSTLHLDHNTAVDFQSDELIRLVEGRIRLTIPGPDRLVGYRIDGPQGWAQIREPGEYRVALLNAPAGREMEVAVIRGQAELANNDGQTSLRAGERAFARAGAAPSYAYVANSAALDAFDRWSEIRREERLAASAEYLPDEVQPYAASLESHGYWRDEPTYGRVWYPRVASDWRPYYRGRWANLRPYGWTWIAHDPWGWPTHHYGRWGLSSAGAWFWIPGRSWGAAWVSWAYAPGYVSWCPLGWNNRPIFQININAGRRHYDPWRAWTVIPRRHFGYGFVHRNVVRAGLIDVRIRGAFAHGQRAPEIRGYAVPRSAAPIRVAGTGRRAGSPVYSNLPAERGRIRGDGARIQVPSAATPDRGVRPNVGARERAVPSRPAVRVERPGDRQVDRGSRRAPQGRAVEGARPSDTGRRAVRPAEPTRSTPQPLASPRAGSPRDPAVQRPGARTPSATSPRAGSGRSAVPRAGAPRSDSAPTRRIESPPSRAPRSTPPAADRSGPGRRLEAAPSAQQPRGARPSRVARPPTSSRPAGTVRPTGPSRPSRAVRPPAQSSRPPQAARPPQSASPQARRPAGAARPPAVSNSGTRPSPSAARPSGGRPSSARPAAASGGARPKAVPRGGRGGGGVR